ncbi:hypothetical protein [Fusobacterium pseudoperiodonticum]|uniref:Uncharacterized protein n=1 Tax=Fusobacterium pseudoperiodonticum TaxID=2663009 RepID=A0AAD0F2C4_9FUSO|nr:hypothetical protein [Fusobacterium pseudoperiodonticum]ATV34641.1 hypothetical protein CTM64_00460 [Fusobacterium pseudoperiodonticum]ATV62466.1 hypothetical protein CTM74_11855 [Fusobacterium pseudoperiodonticum]
MNISEKIALDMEKFYKRYSEEIDEYKKIGNDENFEKLINKLRDLKTYDISSDNNLIFIRKNNITVYFSFYDFEYTNHNIEIAQYHKGENYNLYVSNDDEFITLDELKEMSQMMTDVKTIADEIIGVYDEKK